MPAFPMLTCDGFLSNGRHFRVPDNAFLLNGLRYALDFRRTVRGLWPRMVQEGFCDRRQELSLILRSRSRSRAALACHPRKTVGCISDERFTFCAPPPSRLHFLHNGQRFVLRRIPGRSGRKLRPLQCHMHSRRGISEQARPSPTSSVSSASHHAAESTSSCAAANT